MNLRNGRDALAALSVLMALLALVTGGCRSHPGTPSAPSSATGETRYEFTQPQMGVPFRIVLYATSGASATNAALAAFGRIAQLNSILSDYDPESEVSRLCHDTPVGQATRVSPELWFMLERSQALAEVTGGAFDVTVGPLVNLWRRARRHQELPSEALIAEALAMSGWRKIQLDPKARTVTLQHKGVRLDFGAIAKGYAADEALKVLREHGVARALVAAAGDLAAGDPPPGQRGWKIEVSVSDATNAPAPRNIWVHNVGVASSGDIFQRLEIAGRRYSHILDPRTGRPLTDHSLVTVIAPDGTTADSLSTAVSVVGPIEGLKLIERTPGAAARILRSPKEGPEVEVSESRRFKRWLER